MHLGQADVRAVLLWDVLIGRRESALAAFSSGRVIPHVRRMILDTPRDTGLPTADLPPRGRSTTLLWRGPALRRDPERLAQTERL